MTEQRSTPRRVAKGAGLVLAGAVGASALTGLAYAEGDAAEPPVGQERGARGGWGAGLGPVLHAEAVIRDRAGEVRTVLVQDGTITAVAGDSITLESSDGYRMTYTIDGGTVVRVDRETADAAALAVGQQARVIADENGTADRIGGSSAVGKPPEVRQRIRDLLRENLPEAGA